MMTTPSSKTKILLKKLLVAPLVAGFIFAFAQRVEAQEKLPQVVEVKEQLQNNNELLIFINKEGKLNIKNQIVAYSNLNKVLNKEIDDINEAKIILKTDPNAPLRFANLTKIKNALRQNGIYSINFENFIVSPKDKIIIKNKNWSSKTVRPQVIEVVEQQKTGFHKNWFITIDGQKYYYTFDRKERVARYYKNGKLVKLNIVKEYGKKHKLFERLKSTGKHYVFKSKKEQKIIDREFSDLGGMYYRMPRKNKNKVSRPDHPSKPYVTLWKSGEKFYKKRSELTKEDRLLMMPPPPPPNASKEELKKFKASMRTWRERTGQKIQVREIKPERIEVIKKKKKDSKPQIREVKPVKIEVIKKKNGLVEVIETPDWKGAKKKLKEVEELTEVKELVEVRELKEVEEEEVVEQHELREVEESIEVKEAPLVIEILEDVKEQEFVTIDKIDSLTNDEIIALNKVQKSNSKKIYYINNKEISKKKFKKLKLGKIKKLRVKKGKDKVSHIYITL